MSNESLHRSILPNHPIDPSSVRVLRTLGPIAQKADSAYFVAGAAARDLILVNIHGLRSGRTTRDIDFGIAVENWDRPDIDGRGSCAIRPPDAHFFSPWSLKNP